jgi:hypothetical protein
LSRCRVAGVALIAIGCGGATGPADGGSSPPADAINDTSSDGHGLGNDGSGSAASGDGASTDGTSSGTDGAASPPYYGKVQYLRVAKGTSTTYEVLGVFEPSGSIRSALVCPPGATTSGPCCLFPPAQVDAGSNPYASLSAGTLSVTVGGTPLTSLAYDAQMMGYDPVGPTATTLWDGNEVMQVSATGATVQAFSGSVALPAAIQGLSVQAGATVTVNRSADWTATWTPGQGKSTVLLSLYTANTIRCVADDIAGTLTVPSALLGQLQTGSGGGRDAIEIESVAVGSATSPNAAVELGAFNQVFAYLVVQP